MIKNDDVVRLTLRVTKYILKNIEKLSGKRIGYISQNTMILEALEKQFGKPKITINE